MGQRLNVEIWNNGKVLANAYYHWSAYTESAAEIVCDALNYINSNPIQDDNDLLYAIRILEATGAGLTDREIEHAKTIPALDGETFAECGGRNEGLIAISDEGISETRDWQEGAAHIYLDEKRVSFRVFWTSTKWEWEKEQREDYENENANARNLERVKFNLDDIKFHDWKEFYKFVRGREQPFICVTDGWNVITPID